MATRAAEFIETSGMGLPMPFGPFHLEVWRVPTFTSGDTVNAITPKRGRFIQGVVGGTHNLSTSGNATSVTVTITGPSDIWLLVQD
jgi:hypothetical protein